MVVVLLSLYYIKIILQSFYVMTMLKLLVYMCPADI